MKRLIPLIALVATMASPLVGQQDSLLQNAIRLATEGQADSARALTAAWIARLTPSDSTYPEALYAAGVVAGDTESALTYLRRVSIEYARSEWADDALLRMSQMAFAEGQLRSAIRSADRILLDYPFSDIVADAAYWSGRAHLELGERDDGCPLLRRAIEAAEDNFEVENQARYMLQRCPSGEAQADSATRDTGAGQQRTGGPVFSVQVAAVQSAAAADEMMQRLHSEGYEPHVVRDADGLLKVRVGRFPRRADAEALLAELRGKIGGSPFVVEGS
jgi:tetratricopeptide (TPR) repeat protein